LPLHIISSKEEKFNLITKDLDEVLGADLMKSILEERDLVAYWGTAPTGRREQ
jgi:tyrosyl-tRNA synthetase